MLGCSHAGCSHDFLEISPGRAQNEFESAGGLVGRLWLGIWVILQSRNSHSLCQAYASSILESQGSQCTRLTRLNTCQVSRSVPQTQL